MRVADSRSIVGKPSACQPVTASPTYGDTGVSDAPLHVIHRGNTGVIPLARKEHGQTWEPLGALTVGQPLLPELFRLLAHNAYFGLNTSYGKPAPRPVERKRSLWQPIPGHPGAEERVTVTKTVWTKTHPATGLPLVEHSNNTLRWLNVVYADIDCYKIGRDLGQTLGALVTLQEQGALPPASMFVRSGRGLWVYWLLRDVMNPAEGEQVIHGQVHKPNTPQRATRHALREYAAVQGALAHTLQHLGADLGAMDAPRFAPIPGTKKSTPGSAQVLYTVQLLESGTVPLYTLPELKTALGVRDLPAHPHVDAAFTKTPLDVQQQHGQRGHRQRWRYVVLELEALFTLRHGYGKVQSRHQAALWHAAALKRSGMETVDVVRRVREFWNYSRHKGRDVLTNADLAQVMKQATKRQTLFTRLRRETYLRALNVTPEERSYMDAAAGRLIPPPPPAAPRQQERLLRLVDAVNHAFDGKPPSVRVMCEHLRQHGVDAGNHTTVHRDYLRLGFRPTGKPGRPPKLPEL